MDIGGMMGIGSAQAAPMGTIAGGAAPPPILPSTPPPAPSVPTPSVPQQTMMATAPQQTILQSPQAAPATPAASPVSEGSPNAFDSRFKGTPLEGKWDAVRASAEKYGIKPELAAAVMAHETGNGKNVRYNNPGGLMDPATGSKTKLKFDSIDKGIDRTVGTIAKNLSAGGGELSGLAQRYAPVGAANDPKGLNNVWLSQVQKQMSYFQMK